MAWSPPNGRTSSYHDIGGLGFQHRDFVGGHCTNIWFITGIHSDICWKAVQNLKEFTKAHRSFGIIDFGPSFGLMRILRTLGMERWYDLSQRICQRRLVRNQFGGSCSKDLAQSHLALPLQGMAARGSYSQYLNFFVWGHSLADEPCFAYLMEAENVGNNALV